MNEDRLTAGAVARQLGVAVTTLRTWHRRYGLGHSTHQTGRHRRYTTGDLARLGTMRRLTMQGVPAAEAARVARGTRRAATPPLPRGGGGNALPLGRADPAARGLAAAAMRLDVAAMHDIVRGAVRVRGVVAAWDQVLRPVLAGVGDRHARSNALIEVEHLLSRSISEVLAAVPRPTAGPPAHTLLTCANEEQHSLPLEALAAALAESGTASRFLGARVPTSAILAAIRRTGPSVVVVWSHTSASADPAPLYAILKTRPRAAVVAAAGPGWDAAALPKEVERPADLSEALELATMDGLA